ncbi:MAG TPA: RNase III inhibitor, partial [Clostridiales bacterium]|nr:RNase III inhibitor [Clostridiales bacterium]
GAYRFPVRQAAKIAVRTVHDVLKENPDAFDLVEWVLFDDNTYQIYQEEIRAITQTA